MEKIHESNCKSTLGYFTYAWKSRAVILQTTHLWLSLPERLHIFQLKQG